MTSDPVSGRLQRTTLLGATADFGYNGYGELLSQVAAHASAGSLYEAVHLEHDALGRIVKTSETVGAETHLYEYAYHVRGWLEQVKRDDVVVATYTYDQNGNRLDDGALYDRQDRLTDRAASTYIYGENGDLVTKETSIPSGVETTEYDYDVLGGLRSVTLPDGRQVDYVLDPVGRRIRKDVAGTPTESWLYRSATQPVLWTHDGAKPLWFCVRVMSASGGRTCACKRGGPMPAACYAALRNSTTGRARDPSYQETTRRNLAPRLPRILRWGAAHGAVAGYRARGSNRGLRFAGFSPCNASTGVAPPRAECGRCRL